MHNEIKEEQAEAPLEPANKTSDKFLPASILIAALMISGSWIYTSRYGGAAQPAPKDGEGKGVKYEM